MAESQACFYADQAAALFKQNNIKFERDVMINKRPKLIAQFTIRNKILAVYDTLKYIDIAHCLYIEHLTGRQVIVLVGEGTDDIKAFYKINRLQIIGIMDLIPLFKK